MLPILISVSDAPASYFFCAIAYGALRANPIDTPAETNSCLADMTTSFV
jgi:hypothetical protein